jgi:hypothetical protein
MKKRYFKKLAVVFSLGLVIAVVVVYKFSNYFQKQYNDEKQNGIATPFYYQSEQTYYDIDFGTNYTSRYNDAIVKEWSEFLEGKMTKQKLSYFLLDNNSYPEIIKLHTANTNQKNITNIGFDSKDDNVKKFFEFLFYSKEIEKSSVATHFSWNYEDVKSALVNDTIIQQVEEKFRTTNNKFLKNRYWFQVVKSKFYSNNSHETISFFESTKEWVPKNILYYRALAYVAGVYSKNKNYGMSNYLYSIIFEDCLEMRTLMAYNFHPQNDLDFKTSINLARTKDEKAALWALYGFYADEEIAIEEIYKLHSKSKHLERLLIKFINNYETKLNYLATENTVEEDGKSRGNRSQETVQLVRNIANCKNTLDSNKWLMASGYLSILKNEFVTAQKAFNCTITTQDEEQNEEIRTLKLINNLSQVKNLKSNEFSKLQPEIDWALSLNSTNANLAFRQNNVSKWIRNYKLQLYK